MDKNKELVEYKKLVKEKLSILDKIFVKASVGDFSQDVNIPKEEGEFTGLFVGVQVMLEVIREKLRKLEKDKKELEILVDNLPVGIYIAEVPSGKPILTNKKAAELMGKEFDPEAGTEEYTGAYNVVNKEGEPYPKNEHPIFITIKTGKPAMKRDLTIRRNDGTQIALKARSVPVFDKKGNMTSVLAVFDDITKGKELERLKVEFVSLASHQLRTPLGSIRWNLEMMMEGDFGELPNEAKKIIVDVYTSNQRMIMLVNNLLDVTRIEQGDVSDEPEETDVKEVIDGVIYELKPEAKNKGISIKFSFEENRKEAAVIMIDKTRLRQVLLNVLSNAIKYNKDNGEVSIKLNRKGKKIKIEVEDTGIGIKREDRDKIFTKFFRSEDAAQKDADGSGLGLFLVKSYMQRWGGGVDFESEYKKGTKFTLTLPINPKN